LKDIVRARHLEARAQVATFGELNKVDTIDCLSFYHSPAGLCNPRGMSNIGLVGSAVDTLASAKHELQVDTIDHPGSILAVSEIPPVQANIMVVMTKLAKGALYMAARRRDCAPRKVCSSIVLARPLESFATERAIAFKLAGLARTL
jgi:hypothetical protein